MKKTLSILFATVLIFTFAFILSSCNKEVSFNVNFMVDDEVYNTVSTKGKEAITLPNNPVKEGYAFEGWYRDNETWQNPFNDSSLLDQSLSKDIKVYAKFKVSYDTGNLIYSITDTACTVTGVKDNTVSEIVIPDYVTKINIGAFASCANLTNIDVEKNNTNYKSVDGNLYDINCIQLIKYAVAKKDAMFSIPDTVTSIANSAFSNCTSLMTIIIPSSVISIDYYAFLNCYKLFEVINHSSLKMTKGSTKYGLVAQNALEVHNGESKIININGYLFYKSGNNNYLISYSGNETDITLPANYNNENYAISSYAFYDCLGLTSITIPDSVTNIGFAAFKGCSNLESITIPSVDTHFGYIFGGSNSDSVPSNLQTVVITNAYSIDQNAFSNCSSLKNVVIPDSVTELQLYSFSDCTSLKSINIPDSIKIIGIGIFLGCTSLKSITIPEGVTTIGDYAFYDCSGLTNITIPNSVTSIGNYAFDGCSSLIYNEYDNAYYLGNDTNPYLLLVKAKNTSITSCKIHEDTKFIYNFAFKDCSSLKSITIPNSVTSIGNSAFEGCSSLESIATPYFGGHFGYLFGASSYSDNPKYIPSSLKTVEITGGDNIAGFAFYKCSNLTKIIIPNSITNIGNYVFNECTNLVFNEYDNAYYLGNDTNPYLILVKAKNTSITSCKIHKNTKFIHSNAFNNCISLISVTIPNSVTHIGRSAFLGCSNLKNVTFENSTGWRAEETPISSSALANKSTAAKYLNDTYYHYTWTRS